MSILNCHNLLLWRHADAEPLTEFEGLGFKNQDSARLLSKKGLKQAEKMAAWLCNNMPKNTLIISSNAIRAEQTAQALKHDYIVFASLSPAATLQEVVDTLNHLPKQRLYYESLLVIGHQPWLGLLAAQLLCLPLSLPKNSKEISIKKGTMWWFKRKILTKNQPFKLLTIIAPSLL